VSRPARDRARRTETKQEGTSLRTFTDAEAEAFRERTRAWLSEHVPAEWNDARMELDEDRQVQIRRDWDHTLYEAGLAGLSWPTEYGGCGLSTLEIVIFNEECARAGAPEGLGRIGRLLTGPTLIAAGSDEQQRRYLPGIISGTETWCQGFSEPEAGSDLANVSTRAVRDGSGYRISGQKIWTSFAHYADRCLMLAKTSPEGRRHHNLSMFLVDMNQPGIDISSIEQISGARDFNEVRFDGVYVDDADLVGEENEGWRVAMTVLGNERGAVEAINRYIEIKAIIDLLQDCCGRDADTTAIAAAAARVELVRRHVIRTVETEVNGGDGADALSSILKVTWSELWQQITDLGLAGGCAEHRDRWRHEFLDSRAATIYSGTSEIQRNIIAERVLGLPK
jgi:alkylation response protein AidB-like acyl-CoA dehydrogenase